MVADVGFPCHWVRASTGQEGRFPAAEFCVTAVWHGFLACRSFLNLILPRQSGRFSRKQSADRSFIFCSQNAGGSHGFLMFVMSSGRSVQFDHESATTCDAPAGKNRASSVPRPSIWREAAVANRALPLPEPPMCKLHDVHRLAGLHFSTSVLTCLLHTAFRRWRTSSAPE